MLPPSGSLRRPGDRGQPRGVCPAPLAGVDIQKPHALIALETRAIKASEVVAWDGTKYSNENVDTLKAALVMPPGEVTLAAGSRPFVITTNEKLVVRAKTGNTRVSEERVSWLVGHLEHGSRQYAFVARVRGKGDLPGTAGADLARRYLNEALKRGLIR